MNAPRGLLRPTLHFRPIGTRGPDPGGDRTVGPMGAARDPRLDRGAALASRAWERAKARDLAAAVAARTSGSFARVVAPAIDRVVRPVGLVGRGGSGPFGGLELGPASVAAVPQAGGIGFAFGLRLLEALGAGPLAGPVVRHLDAVDSPFASGLERAWDSAGAGLAIDAAARDMADAVGVLFGLVLQAYVAHLARELAGPALGRLRPVLDTLGETPFFRITDGLRPWTLRNYDRFRDEFSATTGAGGRRRVAAPPADSGSGLLRPRVVRIRPVAALADVSREYRFRTYAAGGKTYQEASGRLGVPGRVRTHRSQSAQRGISAGTGDDAGHLIGNRFGAPGGPENLSTQNWVANRYGTFKDLEDSWAEKLRNGVEIEVTVVDVTRPGEDRPFLRDVRWSELDPDDRRSSHALSFANTQTPRSREARGIAPTDAGPDGGQVIEVDFANKRRLP